MADTQQQPIDYAAAAKQFGATDYQPPATSQGSGEIDYAAAAKNLGATDYQPPASQTPPARQGATGALGVLSGIGGEMFETAQGAKNLVNKVLPASMQIPDIPKEYRENVTPSEKVGGVAENVGEFALGEEALKGVSWLQKLSKTPEVVELIEKYPKAAKILLGAAKAGTVGGAQGAVKGTAEGEGASGAVGGAVGGVVGGAASEAIGPGVKALARIFGLGGRTGEEAMVAAGRPSVGEDANFRQALKTATPRIVDAAKDAPLKTVGEFEDLLHNTAQDIRQKEFGPMIQRNAKQMVSAQPVAANIRSAITDQMREYSPEEAKELEDFAVKFAKDMPLGKAESDLQYFNAQLRKFYKAASTDQSAALKTSGTVAKYEAAADGLRDLIYGRLRELGENAPEDLQKQYGALKTLERTFAKRATVADRQAPLNLPQVLSLAGGAGEAATAVLSGHPLAALAGAVPIAVSTAAKMRNAPESLVRQGVKALTKEVSPKAPSAVGKVAKTITAASGAQAGQYVPVLFSNGETHEIHEEDVDKALKQNPGAKVVQ
jgi:hypothetical protein